MKLLANPLIIKMAIGLLAGFFAMVVGVLLIRSLRQEIAAEAAPGPARADDSLFPLETYHAVIQKLKQQDVQLNELRRREAEQARASETIRAAVLANLPSGVVLFDPRGLVQQANPAARAMLGYASPVGLHARELFRGVSRLEASGDAPAPQDLGKAVESALRDNLLHRGAQAEYTCPSGEQKILIVTVSPLRSGRQTLGAACLISDETELRRARERLRAQEQRAGGVSAGAG